MGTYWSIRCTGGMDMLILLPGNNRLRAASLSLAALRIVFMKLALY